MTDYGTLYGLYTTDTDPKTCYTNAILKNAHDEKNNETIFWRNDVAVGWGAIYNDTPVGEGGNGGLCPSQNLVDMYDMANGQSPFSSYDEIPAPLFIMEQPLRPSTMPADTRAMILTAIVIRVWRQPCSTTV